MRLPSPRQRDLLLALLVLVLVGATVYLQLVSWRQLSFDVTVYWEAGERMRAGGELLYAPHADPLNTVGDYIYPPLLAALFAPLTWLPRAAGLAIWGALQLVIVAWLLLALRRLCGVERGRRARDFALVLLISCFAAVWVNLNEGQINLLVVACVASGLALIEEERPLLGGGLIAAAAHLKVLPIVLVGVLVVQGRWRALAGVGVGLVLLLAAPLPWAVRAEGVAGGIERTAAITGQWVQARAGPGLASQDARRLGASFRAPNNSLIAVVHRWFGEDRLLSNRSGDRSPLAFAVPDELLRWPGFAVALLLYLAALGLAWRTRSSGEDGRLGRTAAAGLALTAAALANLLFWSHHLCLLLLFLGPLFALGFGDYRGRRRGAMLVGALLLLTFLPTIEQVPALDRLAIWGLPTLGVLVAWGVTWTTFRAAVPSGGTARPLGNRTTRNGSSSP